MMFEIVTIPAAQNCGYLLVRGNNFVNKNIFSFFLFFLYKAHLVHIRVSSVLVYGLSGANKISLNIYFKLC